jgi:hypothetical protein
MFKKVEQDLIYTLIFRKQFENPEKENIKFFQKLLK